MSRVTVAPGLIRELLREWSFYLFMGGVLTFVCLAVIGSMVAGSVIESARDDVERRDRLSAECVAGNENACRIYEVDFSR